MFKLHTLHSNLQKKTDKIVFRMSILDLSEARLNRVRACLSRVRACLSGVRALLITLLFLSAEHREKKSMSQPHILHPNLQKNVLKWALPLKKMQVIVGNLLLYQQLRSIYILSSIILDKKNTWHRLSTNSPVLSSSETYSIQFRSYLEVPFPRDISN